ncbi:type II toxin-antitoxin system RelE family toxin [Sediminispirochaeta bajacaliforniensis]|uniref:type II toxin-antitoxin system RelE family toxin n=1 Tax=Sediminispirochaeta bajacaliforniensis TaxID=148 RepID=UPI00037EAAB3|nr:type II toxin-antitoxin system mRNA interferase toxin, RelE/StbE family [Sediminispirochaeta bajacaliforniensis]
MSDNFVIAETDNFQKKVQQPEYKKLYKKIVEYVYPLIKRNPYFGPNIKRLKGDYSEFYRYRIGNYRLFYAVEGSEVIIYIIDIVHRKDAYK